MTWILAITTITVNGLRIGIAVPIGTATACMKAGMEPRPRSMTLLATM